MIIGANIMFGDLFDIIDYHLYPLVNRTSKKC